MGIRKPLYNTLFDLNRLDTTNSMKNQQYEREITFHLFFFAFCFFFCFFFYYLSLLMYNYDIKPTTHCVVNFSFHYTHTHTAAS